MRVEGAHIPEPLPQDDLVVAAVAGAHEDVAALGVNEDAVDHFFCNAPRGSQALRQRRSIACTRMTTFAESQVGHPWGCIGSQARHISLMSLYRQA